MNDKANWLDIHSMLGQNWCHACRGPIWCRWVFNEFGGPTGFAVQIVMFRA